MSAGAEQPSSVPRHRHGRPLFVVLAGTAAVLLVGGILVSRAASAVNQVPLGAAPRPVTVVEARLVSYRDGRDYVGAVDSWIEADVGPQYISAYAESVLVRPGDRVKRGEVLATMDCSNPSAARRATEMQARAIDARSRFVANEAARVSSLLDGGFVAVNDVEGKTAQSSAADASLLEAKARVLAASLDVRDCVLRAPFDGEVATRTLDPGAFVRPGTAIVSIVDRRTVRIVVDAPEKDFGLVAPSTAVRVRMLATGVDVGAPIARRAPKADPRTRTVRIEVDVPDPRREYPTGTTAILHLDVGEPVPATEIPLYSVTQRGAKAKLFVVAEGVAHARESAVLGEQGGVVFFDPKALPEHTLVVTEGRALLSEGDRVDARIEPAAPSRGPDGGTDTRGGGFGGPF